MVKPVLDVVDLTETERCQSSQYYNKSDDLGFWNQGCFWDCLPVIWPPAALKAEPISFSTSGESHMWFDLLYKLLLPCNLLCNPPLQLWSLATSFPGLRRSRNRKQSNWSGVFSSSFPAVATLSLSICAPALIYQRNAFGAWSAWRMWASKPATPAVQPFVRVTTTRINCLFGFVWVHVEKRAELYRQITGNGKDVLNKVALIQELNGLRILFINSPSPHKLRERNSIVGPTAKQKAHARWDAADSSL